MDGVERRRVALSLLSLALNYELVKRLGLPSTTESQTHGVMSGKVLARPFPASPTKSCRAKARVSYTAQSLALFL